MDTRGASAETDSPGIGINRVIADAGGNVPAESHAAAGKGAALVGARRPLVGNTQVGRVRHDADVARGDEVRRFAAVGIVGAVLFGADMSLISLGTNICAQLPRTRDPQLGCFTYCDQGDGRMGPGGACHGEAVEEVHSFTDDTLGQQSCASEEREAEHVRIWMGFSWIQTAKGVRWLWWLATLSHAWRCRQLTANI